MNDDELAAIAQAAQSTAIVRAGNMSLGVNLLTQLTQKVAAALGESSTSRLLNITTTKRSTRHRGPR